ncbi:MAG: ATP-grasp domain-containing protein [Gammaproteobacteria bacterium]|jgi:predicted ATP-grasp superfamily ATP-dependent carboligase
MAAEPILIIGASARAAAFSTDRAGYAPYWLDQYGDADLRERFPGLAVTAGDYPRGLTAAAGRLPPMPFMLTGAMENHLAVLDALAGERPLLGNDSAICRAVRDPFAMHQCLEAAGLPGPVVTTVPAEGGNWLCKPLRSAGGQDIAVYEGGAVPSGCYLQEFIQGQHVSAVFVGDGRRAWLAGVTRQLVGKAAFHAAPFAYCGSLGPLALEAAEARQWRAVGNAVTDAFGLRGLFGVDAVQRGESIYPVEVNPRYTASVEVIEAGTGLALIDHHIRACRGEGREAAAPRQDCFGKCHLFAPARLGIDIDLLTLPMPCEMDAVTLADVPPPGTLIEAGRPVLTLLAGGRDQRECLRLLTEGAAAVLKRVRSE